MLRKNDPSSCFVFAVALHPLPRAPGAGVRPVFNPERCGCADRLDAVQTTRAQYGAPVLRLANLRSGEFPQ